MIGFCTTLDSGYLPRALLLYRSLERHASPFHLYVLCMDPMAARVLERLGLSSTTTIDLAEIESADPELVATKAGRTMTEYCWTAKPSLCRLVLEREPGMESVTYVDSDLMFFADPRVLVEELDDGSILLVPHRFRPEDSDTTRRDGIYNAGWITFANDTRARAGLDWWRARCLEWCYDRREPGRFADQKYLEGLADVVDGVRAIRHPGGGLAPWNGGQHTLTPGQHGPLVDGRPVVFYHYQSLRLVRASVASRVVGRLTGYPRVEALASHAMWWVYPGYNVLTAELDLLWRPYVRQMFEAIEALKAVEPHFDVEWTPLRRLRVASALHHPAAPSVSAAAAGFAAALARRCRRAQGTRRRRGSGRRT